MLSQSSIRQFYHILQVEFLHNISPSHENYKSYFIGLSKSKDIIALWNMASCQVCECQSLITFIRKSAIEREDIRFQELPSI